MNNNDLKEAISGIDLGVSENDPSLLKLAAKIYKKAIS